MRTRFIIILVPLFLMTPHHLIGMHYLAKALRFLAPYTDPLDAPDDESEAPAVPSMCICTESLAQELRDAFEATGLPNPLLSEICGYCENIESITITLPQKRWYQRMSNVYHTHSAISVSFLDNRTLRVLTTDNQHHTFLLPDALHSVVEPANTAIQWLYEMNAPAGSIFVANRLTNDHATSDSYEAKIVGDVGFVSSNRPWVVGFDGSFGRVWYDDAPEFYKQPRTTIKVSERQGVTLANILGVNLPKKPAEKKDDGDDEDQE